MFGIGNESGRFFGTARELPSQNLSEAESLGSGRIKESPAVEVRGKFCAGRFHLMPMGLVGQSRAWNTLHMLQTGNHFL